MHDKLELADYRSRVECKVLGSSAAILHRQSRQGPRIHMDMAYLPEEVATPRRRLRAVHSQSWTVAHLATLTVSNSAYEQGRQGVMGT